MLRRNHLSWSAMRLGPVSYTHLDVYKRQGVRRLDDLVRHIIPFFEQYPLLTAKAGDFSSFAKVVRLMEKGFHLSLIHI